MSDPMEELIREALLIGGHAFHTETEPDSLGLDFYLPDARVHIEVKRFHSDRIAEQMARVPNVIVAQGDRAVALLAKLLAEAA